MKCIKIPSEDFIFIGEKIESLANKCVFHPMGLSLSSMRILGYLHNKKVTTAKELILLTGKSKSNITQRLNTLEKNGLVTRNKNILNKDKRETFLKITPLGKSRVREALRKINKFHLAKEKTFSKEELNTHVKFMKKLKNFLDNEEAKLKKF